MATYDPQKGHARPTPAADEPAPVDELLDAAEPHATDDEPTDEADVTDAAPSPVSPAAVAEASPAPAQVGGTGRGLPAKKVGAGVALTAVVFALSWALRRKRRNRDS